MKATDLMIGDWVKIKGHLDYDKVQEIARDENMQWYISFACSATLFRAYEFEPIPLTPEILEKNGWQSFIPTAYTCCQDHLSIKNEGDIHIEWNWEDGTLSVWVSYSEDEEGTNPNLKASVRYVHELQDALRLVGLNELADNFKI